MIGFSKTKTTCPVSAGADWSIFSANQFSSMRLIECTARKMIIVLSAIPLRLRETGSDNAHFCLDNINKKPFNTYKFNEAKSALETFDEICEVDVIVILQKLISMLKKVPINHGGCKVYTFLCKGLNSIHIFSGAFMLKKGLCKFCQILNSEKLIPGLQRRETTCTKNLLI